ncbi:GNAT family N-acetyltransferase [Candidatus Woesearchaeota archaeon]|nr:GNAT family N-acetyltransferase [Candidatus Woesearchaeota archaeon]
MTVARLREQKSGRNRLLITEVEEAERDIGYIYFRVLPQKILADGFSIGEVSTTYIAPEEAEQFRGKGLGTRVLETAERLFKKRYGASSVEFESEMVFSKEGIHDDPGRFFRRNGYSLRMTSESIGRFGFASFEKRI